MASRAPEIPVCAPALMKRSPSTLQSMKSQEYREDHDTRECPAQLPTTASMLSVGGDPSVPLVTPCASNSSLTRTRSYTLCTDTPRISSSASLLSHDVKMSSTANLLSHDVKVSSTANLLPHDHVKLPLPVGAATPHSFFIGVDMDFTPHPAAIPPTADTLVTISTALNPLHVTRTRGSSLSLSHHAGLEHAEVPRRVVNPELARELDLPVAAAPYGQCLVCLAYGQLCTSECGCSSKRHLQCELAFQRANIKHWRVEHGRVVLPCTVCKRNWRSLDAVDPFVLTTVQAALDPTGASAQAIQTEVQQRLQDAHPQENVTSRLRRLACLSIFLGPVMLGIGCLSLFASPLSELGVAAVVGGGVGIAVAVVLLVWVLSIALSVHVRRGVIEQLTEEARLGAVPQPVLELVRSSYEELKRQRAAALRA